MPLDQVLVIKATNLTMGYSFVGIDSDRGSVWDASKSAYGTTISAASFALGGSEKGFLHYLAEPSEVRKLELKQGTKLQLASFGSTRLKGEERKALGKQALFSQVSQEARLAVGIDPSSKEDPLHPPGQGSCTAHSGIIIGSWTTTGLSHIYGPRTTSGLTFH